MKRILDETVRLLQAVSALALGLILMLIYYNGILPRYGQENSRIVLIVFGVIALLLLCFAVFSLIMYFLIRRKRKRREEQAEAKLNSTSLDANAEKRISREDILPAEPNLKGAETDKNTKNNL